ncbi:MAG: hypothetical protein U9N59_09035 [Campylobacterota bacterium]|nr:hypothetical protein [Campylobacterota bacterium]
MKLQEYLNNTLNSEFSRYSKIILMLIYAIIMFGSILNEINIFVFILLFAIAPLSIYYFTKKIFP